MGQYYTPILMNGNSKKAFLCYDYGNGAKLMEHSYIGNSFVETVVHYMLNSNKIWRLAWVGDYAEKEDIINDTAQSVEAFLKYEQNENKKYVSEPKVDSMANSTQLYFINHTRKEYINMTEYFQRVKGDKWGCVVHPLPLLTAIGNGKGGGDYHGMSIENVGRWACNSIEVALYMKEEQLKEYKPICPVFEEK